MSSTRKTYSADFKTKVALEAIRGELTANQIATRYEAHPSCRDLQDATHGLHGELPSMRFDEGVSQ